MLVVTTPMQVLLRHARTGTTRALSCSAALVSIGVEKGIRM